MANFFSDNKDLQFHLGHPMMRKIVELKERGFAEKDLYDYAPQNFEDAMDSYRKVLEIAGGRVWSGADALGIGLIDSYGGLKEAIAVAADKAGLEQFRVEERLEELDGFAAFFAGMNARLQARFDMNELGEAFGPYKKAREILSQRGVLMYCPYAIELE